MLQKRRLGSTGIWVSPLGLGTVKFGRNEKVKYPTQFQLPSEKEIAYLLSSAYDLGINLLDTAPAYGLSEERIGKCLINTYEWVISTKVGEQFSNGQSHFDFSKSAIESSIHESLKKLKREFVDIVLIHSNGEDENIIQEGVFEMLEQIKLAGKIRAFGMSSKTVSGGLLSINHADLAMVTYHRDAPQDVRVIRRAEKLNKGILIKKAFASGHSSRNVHENLQFIFTEKGVSSVIIGTINPLHLLENISACQESLFI